jgi:glycine/D-amino acid oxidase-like deaminating enzyme
MNAQSPDSAAVDIAIIGAGVIGLACAFVLAEAGREVVLFDPAPGRGASFGNAGGITPGWVAPTATLATLRTLPRMLTDPLSPLVIRPSYLPRLMPWLLQFALAARPRRVEAISKALAMVAMPSVTAWQDFAARAGVSHLLRQQGLLYVYASAASRAGAEAAQALRRKRGVRLEDVDAAWLRSFAPMLSHDYRYGVYSPEAAHIVDPGALCDGLLAATASRGGRIQRLTVDDLIVEPVGIRVLTAQGSWLARNVVLACGAHSRSLAIRLGVRVPLDVERGYHAMLPRPGVELPAQLLDGEGKYALTSMSGGLRLAGTVELGGLALPPDPARSLQLIAHARRLLPDLDASDPRYWMGFRPSLPDGLPVIGFASASARAILAFGHAHIGMTLAPVTAAIVADLLAGRPSKLDLAPFSPTRYH